VIVELRAADLHKVIADFDSAPVNFNAERPLVGPLQQMALVLDRGALIDNFFAKTTGSVMLHTANGITSQ